MTVDDEKEVLAIAFAEWINKNHWSPLCYPSVRLWYKDFGTDKFQQKTTEQLYQTFLQSTGEGINE